MKVKEYPVLVDAVEVGVGYGYMRAYKHNDNPTEEQIKKTITDAVIGEICERFDFDDTTN